MRPSYPLCPVCNRFTRGFGYSHPQQRLRSERGRKSLRYFCSRFCQSLYVAIQRRHGEGTMIDPTPEETAAIRAALKPMAEYIEADIGFDKAIKDYSQQQVLTLVEVIVTAYHEALLAATQKQWLDDVPFDVSNNNGGSR